LSAASADFEERANISRAAKSSQIRARRKSEALEQGRDRWRSDANKRRNQLVLAGRAGVHVRAAGHAEAEQHNHCEYGSRAQGHRPEELHEKLSYIHHRSMMLILAFAKVTIRLRPRNEGAGEAILLINQRLGEKSIALAIFGKIRLDGVGFALQLILSDDGQFRLLPF
jgi:hypothetical protein